MEYLIFDFLGFGGGNEGVVKYIHEDVANIARESRELYP